MDLQQRRGSGRGSARASRCPTRRVPSASPSGDSGAAAFYDVRRNVNGSYPGSSRILQPTPPGVSAHRDEALASASAARSSGRERRLNNYKGVTWHNGKYEVHIWDARQVYLGRYDSEEMAARAYDLAALKFLRERTQLNFPEQDYSTELLAMRNMSKEAVVAELIRSSSGFFKSEAKYRGVTRHGQNKWHARIHKTGRTGKRKDLFLGTFETAQRAAEAYDIACIKLRGKKAVINFHILYYNLEQIEKVCHCLTESDEDEETEEQEYEGKGGYEIEETGMNMDDESEEEGEDGIHHQQQLE